MGNKIIREAKSAAEAQRRAQKEKSWSQKKEQGCRRGKEESSAACTMIEAFGRVTFELLFSSGRGGYRNRRRSDGQRRGRRQLCVTHLNVCSQRDKEISKAGVEEQNIPEVSSSPAAAEAEVEAEAQAEAEADAEVIGLGDVDAVADAALEPPPPPPPPLPPSTSMAEGVFDLVAHLHSIRVSNS
jgi:hypothetical protein